MIHLLLLFFSTAHADIAPKPLTCPQGSYSTRKGRAQWCQESTCSTDADCVGKGSSRIFGGSSVDLKCESVSLCIQKTTRTSRQRFVDRVDTKTYDVDNVLGECDSKNNCKKGSCSTKNRCYSVLPSNQKSEKIQKTTPQQTKNEVPITSPENSQKSPSKTESSTINDETGCSSSGQKAHFSWWLLLLFITSRRAIQRRASFDLS